MRRVAVDLTMLRGSLMASISKDRRIRVWDYRGSSYRHGLLWESMLSDTAWCDSSSQCTGVNNYMLDCALTCLHCRAVRRAGPPQ